MSPELILASYSCARRDHIVRLMRARPVRISSDRRATSGSESLRIPTPVTLEVGTRSVILSLVKLMTNSSNLKPATSCSSMATIWPTPCAGYTTNSFSLKPLRFPVFFMIFCSPPCSSRSFDFVREGALDSFAQMGGRAATVALTRTVSSFARTPGAGRPVAEALAGLAAGASGACTFSAGSSFFAVAAGPSTDAALAEAADPAFAASPPRGPSAPKDVFSAETATCDRRAESAGLALRGIPPGLVGSVSGLDALLLVFLRAAICPHLQTRDEHSRASPAARLSQSLRSQTRRTSWIRKPRIYGARRDSAVLTFPLAQISSRIKRHDASSRDWRGGWLIRRLRDRKGK